MISAKEATTMTNVALDTRIVAAQLKGKDVINIIEQYIKIAAQKGEFKTEFYPFNIYSFTSEPEKRHYITTIVSVLELEGYKIKNHPSNESIEITWPYI